MPPVNLLFAHCQASVVAHLVDIRFTAVFWDGVTPTSAGILMQRRLHAFSSQLTKWLRDRESLQFEVC